jgi:hypothetical protein
MNTRLHGRKTLHVTCWSCSIHANTPHGSGWNCSSSCSIHANIPHALGRSCHMQRKPHKKSVGNTGRVRNTRYAINRRYNQLNQKIAEASTCRCKERTLTGTDSAALCDIIQTGFATAFAIRQKWICPVARLRSEQNASTERDTKCHSPVWIRC